MVALGDVPIPPPAYGGIELVIHELSTRLRARGHEVLYIRGRKRHLPMKLLRAGKLDFVHVHHEKAISRAILASRLRGFKVVATPHMGFPADDLTPDQRNRLRMLAYARYLLPIREDLAERLRVLAPRAQIRVIPNGCNVDSIRFSEHGKPRAICLATINHNKRQAQFAPLLEAAGVPIHYVGPVHEGSAPTVGYQGEWTRAQVSENLTNYGCLVLWSSFEGGGPPLVLSEALAAGLSLVVSPEALAGIDPTLPFVHVVKEREDLPAAISRAIKANPEHRAAAREYAKANFSWDAIADAYESQLLAWQRD